MAGYYGFKLDVRVSVRPSVHQSVRISFPDDNLNKHQWIFNKLGMCVEPPIPTLSMGAHVLIIFV